MNGPHDMGGMQCFGPVVPEPDEPVFHGDWEKRTLALTVGMGFSGQWNLDVSRHARECLPPDFYLSKSYYQIWIAGLKQLMLERGMVSIEELNTGKTQITPIPSDRIVAGKDVAAALAAGSPVERESRQPAKFVIGDKVCARNINPP